MQASTTAGARVIRGRIPVGLTQFVTSAPLIRTRQGWLPLSRQASTLRETVRLPYATGVLPLKSGAGSSLQAVRKLAAHTSATPRERGLKFSMSLIATKETKPLVPKQRGLNQGLSNTLTERLAC